MPRGAVQIEVRHIGVLKSLWKTMEGVQITEPYDEMFGYTYDCLFTECEHKRVFYCSECGTEECRCLGPPMIILEVSDFSSIRPCNRFNKDDMKMWQPSPKRRRITL